METRDDTDVDRGRSTRSVATRRSVLVAAAAGLLGAIGVTAPIDMIAAKRRARKGKNRNSNQSNAVSVGQGGPGGAGGAGGDVIVVCDPGFTNCQEVNGS